MDPWVIGAGDRRSYRFGPEAQHERVVGLSVRSLLREVVDVDLLGFAVDADDLVAGPHVERETLGQALGCLQQEAVRSGISPPMWYGKPQFANDT